MGRIPLSIAVALISIKSQHEIFRHTLPACPAHFRHAAYIITIAVCACALFYGESAMFYALMAGTYILLLLNLFTEKGPSGFQNIAGPVLTVVYPSAFMSFMILILKLPHGFVLVVFLYLVSEVNDSFAQLFGKLLGKKKIFPKLSPNKTYAGAIGGIISGMVAGIAFNYFVGSFPFKPIFIASILIIVTTISGDMVASKIKRDLEIKDFGKFLPLHGGILDIYDSIIFSAPLFYWFGKGFLV
jgi:phosphatidate cytidylyltransferase